MSVNRACLLRTTAYTCKISTHLRPTHPRCPPAPARWSDLRASRRTRFGPAGEEPGQASEQRRKQERFSSGSRCPRIGDRHVSQGNRAVKVESGESAPAWDPHGRVPRLLVPFAVSVDGSPAQIGVITGTAAPTISKMPPLYGAQTLPEPSMAT